MNNSSEQDFTRLLAYQQTESSEKFVEKVIDNVNFRHRFRRRVLMLAGAAATITTALLVGLSNNSNWDAITSFFTQSPMLVFGITSIGLLGGLVLRIEEN
ncbi:hypothetical protein DRW07_05385 [Alteromonas sediminis]|uniref:Uncharacterized protein n=1 Tax=Alteromonas sediminis TaxID=2259342 RepID=A0A3N5Y055_9ALTE|nr:hypothetical protein [Alteromonas sediminis]RPJ66977.1 hypothetical protein DRW07_05385 [Alteromonas sediminis]